MIAGKENGVGESHPPIPSVNIRAVSRIPRWSLALLGFGFLPLLILFFLHLWKLPEYQFFPQALAGAGFLAWDRLREVRRPMVGGPPALSAALLLASFATLALAVSLEALFPQGKCVPAKSPPRLVTSTPRAFSPLWFQTACSLFAVLGLLSSSIAWNKSKSTLDPLRAANSMLASEAVFSLPDRIGDWSRSESGPRKVSKIETLGLSSAIWNCQRPGMQAANQLFEEAAAILSREMLQQVRQ